MWKDLTGLDIREGYGQSETVLICGNFPGSPVKPGSMGKPAPGVPLKVLDENLKETNDDEEGDIAVEYKAEGSSFLGIFQGYLSDKHELQMPLSKGSDGRTWYLTGDRAYRDSDGYFWFVGRADDIINSSGYRIGILKIDTVLLLHTDLVCHD